MIKWKLIWKYAKLHHMEHKSWAAAQKLYKMPFINKSITDSNHRIIDSIYDQIHEIDKAKKEIINELCTK